MMLIIQEGLYYTDTKTRKFQNSPWVKHDTYYHAYIYLTDNINRRNTTNGFNDGVAMEPRNRVYRRNISQYSCADLYGNKYYSYVHCKKVAYCIDLRDTKDGCYSLGEVICGDLKDIIG